MLKCTRLACLLVVSSLVLYLCVCPAAGLAQGYPQQAEGAAVLPDDWPQAITVPGMEGVIGLVQGDNTISYSIRVLSQDASSIYFQVSAFCVSNPASGYAILHVPARPLMGVIDTSKKSLQIDFSPLSSGLESVEAIDKADVNKVLMQDRSTMVLSTVMSLESASSKVRFSISDMSLMQPDGVLDEFSLPGPVPAILDPATCRLYTVAFDEMANVLQQNFIYAQQDTLSVVNEVTVVNVINVAGFGGIPWGGYYGGYDGFYGGFVPYDDPLPLPAPHHVSPLRVPDGVHVHKGGHGGGHDDAVKHGPARPPSKDEGVKQTAHEKQDKPKTATRTVPEKIKPGGKPVGGQPKAPASKGAIAKQNPHQAKGPKAGAPARQAAPKKQSSPPKSSNKAPAKGSRHR